MAHSSPLGVPWRLFGSSFGCLQWPWAPLGNLPAITLRAWAVPGFLCELEASLGIAVSAADSFVMYTVCIVDRSVVCSGVGGVSDAPRYALERLPCVAGASARRSRRRTAEGYEEASSAGTGKELAQTACH